MIVLFLFTGHEELGHFVVAILDELPDPYRDALELGNYQQLAIHPLE